MHPRKIWAGVLALDRRQQNASPCPNRNGQSLGAAQPFTIACGADIGGTTMDTFDAFDLRTCGDICSSFHPRCDGATFDGKNCQLRSRVNPGNVRQSRSLDSVVASFPSSSSNCASLGATTSLGGTAWTLSCGRVIAGFDVGQEHASTLQDCMGQCSAMSNCAAVTFDASQDQGFKNCYFKSQVTDGNVIVQDPRVDTALLQSAGNASPGDGGAGAVPTSPPNQGVATVPLPTPTGGSGNGAVFFMPPSNTVSGSGTGSPNSSPLPTDQTPPPTQLAPPQFLPTGTGGFIFPDGNQQNGNNRDNNRDGNSIDDDNSTSNAWIAAPVVGSVAAIALIVLSFVMLKRRRLGNNGRGSRDTLASQSSSDSLRPARKLNISRPKALSAMITSWLPAAARGDRASGGGGGRGSRGKMGNFSEIESTTGRGTRASMRTSVTGLVRPGVAMGGGEAEDAEAAEKRRGDLRNSLNGLGQNRWS